MATQQQADVALSASFPLIAHVTEPVSGPSVSTRALECVGSMPSAMLSTIVLYARALSLCLGIRSWNANRHLVRLKKLNYSRFRTLPVSIELLGGLLLTDWYLL